MPLRGWLTLLLSMPLAWSVGVHGLVATKALAARDDPAPTILYRGDSRSPDQILKAEGFLPRGSAMNEDAGFSVYLHMRGGSGGGAPVNSAYVSTTSESKVAFRSLGQKSGYIYEIHPTENMFSVHDTLKNHYLYLDQKEWVALGGIRPDQIKAVAYVEKPRTAAVGKNYSPELKFKPFKEYNEAKYIGHGASGPQPELAGFPADHPALEEPKWKALSGKPLREPGLELLNRVQATGWEPPSAALKGKGKPGPELPKNRKPQGGLAAAKNELTTVVEEVSAKEFAELSRKYKLQKVVETKFNQPLPSFRTDKLKYQPFTPGVRPPGKPPSSGPKALKSTGSPLGILSLDSYVRGLVTVFTNSVRAVDRAAAVASIVPLVGCATSVAAELSNNKFNGLYALDAALCVVGDVLLFTPLAPFGVAVHIIRFIMALAGAFPDNPPGPSPELLKQVKDARDGPWQKFLQDHMYQTLSSKEFGARLGSSLAVESLAFLSEGAQTIGVFEASQKQALNYTNDATEQAQLREFFQNATQNVRRRLSVEIVDKQRQVLLDLIGNVRDQHKEASIRALADQYNESFIKDRLADADEEVKKYIRDEKPPLPDRFAIAYLIGQSTGQDADLPTLSPSDVENALSSSDEPTKALAPLKANDNVDWEIHPLTLSLTDYLQKRQKGISKEDADAISIQQTHAIMQFLEGKIGSDEIAKASPELNPSNAQEFQLLVTMKMGRRLKYWKRSEDAKLHFFPEAAANDPASTIASVLGLEQQDVKTFLGKWTRKNA